MATNPKDLIVYVGPVAFPSNSAASRRILGNALAFNAIGYDVIVGSGSYTDGTKIFNYNSKIEIHQIGENKYQSSKNKISKAIQYTRVGKKTIAWLDSLTTNIKAIILYSGYSPFLLRLLPWAKKNNIPIVFDAVEWYEAPTKLLGLINPYYWNIELAMRYLIPRTKNVIAISTYLEEFYSKYNTIIIPPLISKKINSTKKLPNVNQPLKVVSYTGTPGHKDLFDNFLEAFFMVNQSKININFQMAGLSTKEIIKYPAFIKRKLTSIPEFMLIEGRVPHERAVEITRNSDFSLLQRKISKFSKAGFPTKVVESLYLGTPVITNLTSDLESYLTDKENAIIIKDETVESLISAIEKVILLPSDLCCKMSENARKLAIKDFMPSNYAEKLAVFIGNLQTQN